MGVIDNPAVPDVPEADRVAQQLKQQARATYHQLVQVFNQGAQSFWNNPNATASDIAAALGVEAKEIFELHGKIGALLGSLRPAAIAPGLAVIGSFTANEDGTVTIAS